MAPKQSRFMGMFDDGASDKITQAINNKGEIYRLDLYPDQAVAKQAQADFDGFRTGTPAMEQVGQDMRRFYGFETPGVPSAQGALTSGIASGQLSLEDSQIAVEALQSLSKPQAVTKAAAPTEIKETFPVQTTVPKEPPVKSDSPYVTTTVPKQEAPSPESKTVKDSYINKILGYDVQDLYNQIKNTKGIFTDSALTDAAILGGGSLALTGIAGLGGADGGDAIGLGLAGAGMAAAPAIHNAVRNPAYQVPMKNGRGLVAAIAAGAGAGSGTSMLMDALGLTNQSEVIRPEEGVMVRPAPGYVVGY
jgi:hypothetical protein